MVAWTDRLHNAGACSEVPDPTAGRSTRERILYEASLLFRRSGYHGATTRDIAKAVGIRQPSLFHHFASKAAMVDALFESDLDHALDDARSLERTQASAAARVFRYISDDIERASSSPYDLSGVYRDDVLSDPDFAGWAAKRTALHAIIDSLIEQAIDSDEFQQVHPPVVREMIIGALARVLSLYSGRGRTPVGLGSTVASLLVRGLLTEPATLDQVRHTADALRH